MRLESIEALTLAQCLADPLAYMSIADRISPDHFQVEQHRAIWGGLKSAFDENLFSLEMVDARCRWSDDQPPLYPMILGLAAKGRKDPADVQDIAAPLIERQVMASAKGLFAELQKVEDSQPAAEMIDSAISRLEALRDRASGTKITTYAEAQAEVIQSATEAKNGQQNTISTGFAGIDRVLGGGLSEGELTVLLARGGAGKTALTFQILEAVTQAGYGAGFGSYEMKRQQLVARRLAGRAAVSVQRMRKGELLAEEMERLCVQGQAVSGLPLHFDDEGETTVEAFCRRWKPLVKRYNLKAIGVDSIKALQVEDKRLNSDLPRRAGYVIKKLKTFANDTGAHVIALAHETRKERHPLQRPTRSSTYGGSNMEDDPDNHLILHRPEPHLAETMPADETSAEYLQYENWLFEWKNRAEIVADKVRMGRPGAKAFLSWSGDRTEFTEQSFIDDDERLPF